MSLHNETVQWNGQNGVLFSINIWEFKNYVKKYSLNQGESVKN